MSRRRGRVEELKEILGENDLLALFRSFGGQRLYIPSRIGSRHKIFQALGGEAAEKLQAHFGGQTITVPQGREYAIAARNREICRLRASGWTVAALALHFHLSHRWMQRILQNGCSVAR